MRIKTKLTAVSWLLRIFLITYTVFFLYPFIWNILSSFKTNQEFLMDQVAFPKSLAGDNYVRAFQKANISAYFLNSVMVVVLSTCFLLVFIVPTAYSIARYRILPTKIVETIYMICLFVGAPLVPLFQQILRFHMTDNRVWLCLVYAIGSFPFNIFLLSGYMRSIPGSYADAAYIDGCSNFGILTRIIVPLAKSGISTVSMLAAMGYWNEYMLALVLLSSPGKKTLPIGIAHLYQVEKRATDFGALFAALVIVLIPTIIIYLIGQRSLLKGIGFGGLKE